MEQNRLVGGGTNVGKGWISRMLRRAADWMTDNGLDYFFGKVIDGMNAVAWGLEQVGWKTTSLVTDINLTDTEQNELNRWSNTFLDQLKPNLLDFAKVSDTVSLDEKLKLLNQAYKSTAAIRAHYATATEGMTGNMVKARNQFIEQLTQGLQLTIEFLTNTFPVAIETRQTTFMMKSVNTYGITANSPVQSFVATEVKLKNGASVILPPDLVEIAPETTPVKEPVRDNTTIPKDETPPVKEEPAAPKPKKSNNLLLGLVGLALLGGGIYMIQEAEKEKEEKKKKQQAKKSKK
ncbi:hypothetical protein [Flavobacterium sp. UBA4197]|uniref:hypothetical protein n=1 Tax=Flavobacterium sp. UBA4197 TaxID=1946546 RepID=UPI002579724C|nr:hypothetical protein [Flavobacterium sp. UBA4197]HRB72431.1 hypothetical protein [Flavobacterium sp.]